MKNTIEYIIKFCEEKEHADFFCQGNLFMRPAYYYRNLEQSREESCSIATTGGRGDECEGAVSDTLSIFKNGRYLIFCSYIVYKDGIQDGKIVIPRGVIKNFNSKWCGVVSYASFQQSLKSGICDENGNNYVCEYDSVKYNVARNESDLLLDNTSINLFIKNNCYRYQNEHRIVVRYGLPPKLKKITMHDGKIVDAYDFEGNKDNYKIMHFSKTLENTAVKSVDEMEKSGDVYLMSI